MFRYVIICWDAASTQQAGDAGLFSARLRQRSAEWRTVFHATGVSILCTGERSGAASAHTLTGSGGVLLGTIFARGTSRKPLFDEAETARIVTSAGRALLDSHWGAYVAVVREQRSGKLSILRSPMGALPCFETEFKGVRILFSYMPDCAALGLPAFSINWPYIARFLTRSRVTEATGLREIREVRSGECIELQQGRSTRHAYWDPRRLAASPIEDPEEAADVIRSTAQECVQAWACSYGNVIHSLSGGFDSSVVLACLSVSPASAQVACVTHYTTGANGDERSFARLAAARAGCSLVEHLCDAEVDLRETLSAQVSESPQAYVAQLGPGRFTRQLARDRDARAIFYGKRGDELFLTSLDLAPADYLHRHGFRPGFARIVMARAEHDGLSIWQVAREAIRDRLGSGRWDPVQEGRHYRPMMNEEALQSLLSQDNAPPPWESNDESIPLGKQRHLATLTHPEPYYLPFAQPGEPDHVAPLTSQPLVEVCLRIPTYVLVGGGRDRALARRAFASDLPSEIVDRCIKGGTGDHTIALLDKNRAFIREMLLDGALVQHGLLDRGKVESALSGGPSNVMKGTAKLIGYLRTEVWLSIWTRHHARIAA